MTSLVLPCRIDETFDKSFGSKILFMNDSDGSIFCKALFQNLKQ